MITQNDGQLLNSLFVFSYHQSSFVLSDFITRFIVQRKPEIKAEFTSLEFDADDTSYSPQETHSMNQLSKELNAFKEE